MHQTHLTPILLKISLVLTLIFIAIPVSYPRACDIASGIAIASFVVLFSVNWLEQRHERDEG